MECGSEHVQITLCPSGRYIWFLVLPNIVGLFYEEMFFFSQFLFFSITEIKLMHSMFRERTNGFCTSKSLFQSWVSATWLRDKQLIVFSSRAKVRPAIHSVSPRYFSQLSKLFNSSSNHNYGKIHRFEALYSFPSNPQKH